MLGIPGYEIYPCRGEYFLLDPRLGPMLPLPAYPVPNYKTGGLGIHLTPTVDGNIMVGPSNEYIDEREDYAVTQKVMDLLIADGSRIFPHLKREFFIRNFSGTVPSSAAKRRAGTMILSSNAGMTSLPVRSTLWASNPRPDRRAPIAHEVIRLIREIEPLEQNPFFDPIRRRTPSFRDKTPEQQAELIRQNPDYGEIICRCETITKAEVLAALHSPLPARTLTGVKYRCRAMMGRCQGGYCQTRLADLLMAETGLSREELLYSREGSWLFTGEVHPQ